MRNHGKATSRFREEDRANRFEVEGPSRSRRQQYPASSGGLDAFECVLDQYPIPTLVASFGLGLGLGVLAVAVLRPERLFQDESRGWAGSIRDFANESMHDLASGARKVPRMVAERLPEMPFRH